MKITVKGTREEITELISEIQAQSNQVAALDREVKTLLDLEIERRKAALKELEEQGKLSI